MANGFSPARYLLGDVRQILPTLEAGSVDLVLTSPPFLALRSYLPADHPDKPLEIGSEATPGAYIDTLIDVVEACARVLAPHGSMCIELGDMYSGSGGNATISRGSDAWPLGRSLCLIPELFRISLVYGFNPLTGRTTPRWRARNVVRWCRPNPPVGALGDKFRPATTEMVVICCKGRRYFDLDAVRTHNHPERIAEGSSPFSGRVGGWPKGAPRTDSDPTYRPNREDRPWNAEGAPPLDWWNIPTQPYPGAHYATWPEQLCTTPIKAMCPLRVCRTCGKPSERIIETERLAPKDGQRIKKAQRLNGWDHPPEVGWEMEHRTLGWTDCGHNDWRPGLVLDPFAGSGTTLQVATGHGRNAIGIDLDPRNADLAIDRVGPLLLRVEDLSGGPCTPSNGKGGVMAGRSVRAGPAGNR
jgi:hypothetical protein